MGPMATKGRRAHKRQQGTMWNEARGPLNSDGVKSKGQKFTQEEDS